MKKIILSMTLAVALLGSAFATPADKEPSVMVKSAFAKEFSTVKEVKWDVTSEEGVYEARFSFNNESLIAYFTSEGQFIGTMRQISASRLPVMTANLLTRKYSNYHVVSVFEYSRPEGVSYYITVSDSKGGLMLEADGSGDLSVYKKLKQ